MTVSRRRDDARWTVHRWLQGGSGFAANNGLELLFGLSDADRIDKVEVRWPNGQVETATDVPIDSRQHWVYGEVDE